MTLQVGKGNRAASPKTPPRGDFFVIETGARSLCCECGTKRRHQRKAMDAVEADIVERFLGHSWSAGYATSAARANMPGYSIQARTQVGYAALLSRWGAGCSPDEERSRGSQPGGGPAPSGRQLRRGDPARAARARRAPDLNNPKLNRPGTRSGAASREKSAVALRQDGCRCCLQPCMALGICGYAPPAIYRPLCWESPRKKSVGSGNKPA
jgi:hypothetical protein